MGDMLMKSGLENFKVAKTLKSRKRVLTLAKDNESVDSTKYSGMIGILPYLTASRPEIMFSVCLCPGFQEDPKNTEESMNEGEMQEISKKLKRKFKIMKGNEGDERNTTHMMNALKEARMESREMLLSIHHSLKMLLDIISKLKMNDKGKGKVNEF
ncbi:hypothetical protein Tco_1047953 [Tanacetum coccineum]